MSSFPTCALCCTTFKYRGPDPHLLPCLHVVCHDCLTSTEELTITCTRCEKTHPTNQNYPVDHVTIREVFCLTAKHKPSQFLCAYSHRSDGNQAVCWCENCKVFLCEHCQIAHGEVMSTRKHTTTEVGDLAEKFPSQSLSECVKHGYDQELFDKNCQHLICFKCLGQDHTGHDTIPVKDFMDSEQDTIRTYLKSVTSKQEDISKESQTARNNSTSLTNRRSVMKETVQNAFSELRARVDQREKELLVQLDGVIDLLTTVNENRTQSLEEIKIRCQTALDYMEKSLLYSPSFDVLESKEYVKDATQSCTTARIPRVHKHESSVMFSKQGLQNLREAVSSFGSFLTVVGETKTIEDSFDTDNGMQLAMEKLEVEMSNLNEANKELRNRSDLLEQQAKKLREVLIQLNPEGLKDDTRVHLIPGAEPHLRIVLICPKMTLSSDKVNTTYAQVDVTGALIKTSSPTQSTGLQKYPGTTCTEALPSNCLLYWEVDADFNIKNNTFFCLPANVFELAVCDVEVMDNSYVVGEQPKSFSLCLQQEDVVTAVYHLRLNGNTISTSQKQTFTLHQLSFGILCDTTTNTCTVTDITNNQVVGRGRISGDCSKLSPMFGVYGAGRSEPKLQLVSGAEIKVDAKKRELLQKAVTEMYK